MTEYKTMKKPKKRISRMKFPKRWAEYNNQ